MQYLPLEGSWALRNMLCFWQRVAGSVTEWFCPSCRLIDGTALESILGELFTPIFHLELLGYSSLRWWLLNERHWQDLGDEEGWWLGSQPRIKGCQGNEWSLAQNSQLFSNMMWWQFKKKDGKELLKRQNREICFFVLSLTKVTF